MAFRDFSDSALADIKQYYYNCIFDGTYDPGKFQYLRDEYYNICHGDGYDPVASAKKRQEAYDAAVVELEGIFKQVQEYDPRASARYASITMQVKLLRCVVGSLRDIINPYPESGVCALTLPAAELAQKLSANDNALVQIAVSRMMTLDDNGNPVYDWDEIERVLQLPADDITFMEYYVLAYLYSQMGEDDMERFLQRLAEPGEPYSSASSNESRPTWTFDKDKINRLSVCLAASFARQDRSFDNDSLTRMAILQALPELGTNPSDLAESAGLHGLTAASGAEYPPIDIVFSPDSHGGAIIKYAVIGTVNSTTGGIDYPPVGAQCVLLPPTTAANGLASWNQFLNDAQREFFGVGAEDIVGISADILAIPFIFVEKAYWPLSLAMSAGGIVVSINNIYEDQAASEKIGESLDKSTLLGQVYGQFGCQVVIASTTESSTENQLFVYPGSNTSGIINNLNSAIAVNPDAVSLAVGTLGYPVTYEAIIRNPGPASQFMFDLWDKHPGIYEDVFNAV